MIYFKIRDGMRNTIYQKCDEKELTEEEVNQIREALDNIDTNMVECIIETDSQYDNSHISYTSSMRCGKSEMLRQCKELCDEYNKQVAALPVCHPAEHAVTGVREPVEPEEPVESEEPVEPEEPVDSEKPDRSVKPDDRGFVSAPTLKEMLSSDDEIKALHKAISKVLKRNKFYEKPYAWNKDLRHNTSTFCGDYNQQKQIFGNIPGTYVGCGKHERCEKPNKRAEQEEQCNKKECTETCSIEDFIDFLNTYDSWATLIQELQFHSKKQTQQGKTELVNKYKKWKREQ